MRRVDGCPAPDPRSLVCGALAGGSRARERGARGVAIARGGRHNGRSTSARLADLGQLSFAQAEYFFDGTEKKSHWMWRMKWRGRLRRFRMPSKLTSVLGRACPGSAELCGALVDLTRSMESVH